MDINTQTSLLLSNMEKNQNIDLLVEWTKSRSDHFIRVNIEYLSVKYKINFSFIISFIRLCLLFSQELLHL